MKRVSWFCFGSFFCVSVTLVFQRKEAIESKEILLATRHVSTEANKKMPPIHFATESHTEDLESCCFSRWIFAVCVTVYSIFGEASAAGVRSEALIALFSMKVVRVNFTVESFFCVVCRVPDRVLGNAGSEPPNGSGQTDSREIWPCNSISMATRVEPCCFGLIFVGLLGRYGWLHSVLCNNFRFFLQHSNYRLTEWEGWTSPSINAQVPGREG